MEELSGAGLNSLLELSRFKKNLNRYNRCAVASWREKPFAPLRLCARLNPLLKTFEV